MIDVVRFRRDWLSKEINGVWRVMLYPQKNGNPVYVAIPNQAAEAVPAVPPMSKLLKILIQLLCHGRGRGFEPPHSTKRLFTKNCALSAR
jgi:hypothetical protein